MGEIASPPREGSRDASGSALPLRRKGGGDTALVAASTPAPTDNRPQIEFTALSAADFRRSRMGVLDRIEAAAYHAGLTSLFLDKRKAPSLAMIGGTSMTGFVPGRRAAGQMLRTGSLSAGGLRTPIDRIDFRANGKHVGPVADTVQSFGWLRDLCAVTPCEDAGAVASDMLGRWIAANPLGGKRKGFGWKPGVAGARLLAWAVHAPLLLHTADARERDRFIERMVADADWLDAAVAKARHGLYAVQGWSGLVANGLVMRRRARVRYGEAGLLAALGDAVSEDGGILSRSPADQYRLIETLTDLAGCYDTLGIAAPDALQTIRAMLFPPLLALRHGDGGLGNWQGSGGIDGEALDRLRRANGIRTRALLDAPHWGYRTLRHGDTIVQFDAAPPPPPAHTTSGCASTLAFEFSHENHRLIVNCGGASLAGGALPARLEQGMRGTAAHSTLVLDEANSTAILLNGGIGKGVQSVDATQTRKQTSRGGATTLTALHDGYASRLSLNHRRSLTLRDDGLELVGEDILLPSAKHARRGKIACAIRFHCGPDVTVRLEEGAHSAMLCLPDGGVWRFSVDEEGAELGCEASLWVDGEGSPHETRQLVVAGLVARSGHTFGWRFAKMG